MLLRYFKKSGERLFTGHRDNQRLPTKCLDGTEILLSRYFTVEGISNDYTRSDKIMAYLEPIDSLLEGVVTKALSYDRDEKSLTSLIFAILDALHLPTNATDYAAVCDDADIWQDIKTVTRDRLFQKKNMQACLSFIYYLAFEHEIREHYILHEEKLWAENEKGTNQHSRTSLSLALLSSFGETAHHHDLVVASRKAETYQCLSIMLTNCTVRVFKNQADQLYINEYVASYLVATLDYILDSLRKDQYSLPDGLDTLPVKLRAVMKNKSYTRCDPQFLTSVEKYLALFEEQILNTLTAFSAMRISKEDLQRLDRSPHILQTLNRVAFGWGLEVCSDTFLSCPHLQALLTLRCLIDTVSFFVLLAIRLTFSRLNLTAADRVLTFVMLASCC